jgi:phenylalanine-4-hydroxylase
MDVAFTEAHHRTWRRLFDLLEPRLEKFACREYLGGFAKLAMSRDTVPTVPELNARITPATGWEVVRTTVRYSDAVDWYRMFDAKKFLITNYIREEQELEFTPEPDMFHDVFGHLPFMTLPAYAELQEMFAPAFLAASPEVRENIRRLNWYSTEFGMIREDGGMKIFGAGLLSSAGEMEAVMAGKTPIEPFVCENVVNHAKSVDDFNSVLFVADDLDAYKDELGRYFAKMIP